ncbi:Ku protein [Prauserella marina]|uniref:Non-homologous end joining protein Ku n=1 Tax=Prauserella marina TaxID=530584 RepID=A0A222VLP2_9PSEU|nr:Ku protein [Prauserella marina]ASR34752.1 Ku protein [Prauserella marina]PWV85575.1 Ku protein [Prauserella marina]SDC51485.1 DNA end-binding protein Ku [Prauserella marina]
MRTVWKGTIGFGSFAIPVKAYSATGEYSSGLTQVHAVDGGRIRYKRVCEVDDAEVPQEEIAKGYTTAGGEVVVLSEADLAELADVALPTAHSIQILGFVDPGDIDPLYFVKSYYLEPEVPATKPYVLLGEALQQAGRVAVVRVTIRQRETLGALSVRGKVVMLDTMHWPGEIRTPDFPFLHEDVDLRVTEVKAAANMIENLSLGFDPADYPDTYSDALAELIEARIEGREVLTPSATVQEEGVAELLRALQESTQDRADTDQAGAEGAAEPAGRAGEAARRAETAAEQARRAAEQARSAPRTNR